MVRLARRGARAEAIWEIDRVRSAAVLILPI